MDIPKTRWKIAARLPEEANQALLDYPLFLRQILYNRGFTTSETAKMFLEAGMPPGTDPFCLLGMTEAVGRIRSAIENGELIAVYGDYDADGVTATALLVHALKAMGAKAREYIPNRFDEGYGLNKEALNTLQSEGVRVVITVDCGIRSLDEADHASEIGLDLIITDHHNPGGRLPKAIAVINPKQDGERYPEKDLAGVGIAYKLASALFSSIGRADLNAEDYLDLVALGTVSDLAPLKGENRWLVRAGIERLRHYPRQGVLSLMGATGLTEIDLTTGQTRIKQISAGDIGYILGPRLNAAGRIESAMAALDLLTSADAATAGDLAQALDNQNRERQRITQAIQAQAEVIALSQNPDALLLFAAHAEFNPGVVGLAASRLMEIYYRPAIVAHQGEEFTRGSCRSITELHITEALDTCEDLLVRHGGHAAAAGFTVRNENLPELISRLNEHVAERLTGKDLRKVLSADYELPLDQVTLGRAMTVLKFLDQVQPCGMSNPQPVFVSRNLRVVERRAVGRENGHLKLRLAAGTLLHDAIAFRQGHLAEGLPERVDILYCLERNDYNGQFRHQLNIKDIKAAGTPDD